MQYTIKDILEKYKIVIPQIQRDYAQGRKSATQLRKNFISKIKSTLQEDNSESLNLDFVYGYIDTISSDTQAFIPLDGQQRLTTLWLLLWVISPRHEYKLTENDQRLLSNFTYETRASTKRFCHELIYQHINIDVLLSEQIIDAPWYMASWNNDPTIISMLTMLDTIQVEITDKNKAYGNLVANKKITFDFIDIKSEEFKLTDELYIKMNSRGKPLTTFENFKAQFASLLSSKTTDYNSLKLTYKETKVSYQEYFAFKIDSSWTDLFWSYRQKVSTNIDDCIYNYINFLAEFLFYKNNPDNISSETVLDFNFLNEVFKSQTNIDILFKSLDWLTQIKIEEFFEQLFNGLSTFDNFTSDYFKRSITNSNFDVKDKIIFYAVIQWSTKLSITEVDNELRDFIRIIRNLLFTVRQPNQSRKIEYVSNLRLTDASDYCRFIDNLIDKKIAAKAENILKILSENDLRGFSEQSISNEKSKILIIILNPQLKSLIQNLEEHDQIKGNLCNFKLETDDIQDKIKAFFEIWSRDIDSSLIARALLTIGNYSVKTHDYTTLGPVWYFGSKGYWNRILTNQSKIADILNSFLTLYLKTEGVSPADKLQKIVDEFNPTIFDFRYYFVKYKEMTRDDSNIFAGDIENSFNINSLGNSGSRPLNSYHTNPYLRVIRSKVSNISHYSGRFTETSSLKINDDITLSMVNKGLMVTILNGYILDKDLLDQFQLDLQPYNKYLLKASTDKDFIETSLEFIKKLKLNRH